MATNVKAYDQPQIPASLPLMLALAGLAVVGIIASNFNPHLLFHLGLFVFGLLIVWRVAPIGEARTFIQIYVVGYLLRLVAIALVQHLWPDGLVFFDDRGYDDQARYLASGWSLSNLSYAANDLDTTHIGYPLLLSALYGWLGPSVFSGEVFNAFFGALTAPVAYFLVLEVIGDKDFARAAAWLTALFLYDVMWAGFLLKDTILLFLFTATILIFVRVAKRWRIIDIVAAIVLLALLQIFRFYTIAVLALGGAVALVVRASQTELFPTGRARVWSGVLLLILACAGFWVAFGFYGGTNSALAVYSQAIEQFEAVPDNSYALLRFTPSLAFLIEVVKGILTYQLGPFPGVFWGVDLTRTLFYPGMYLIYCSVPFFLLGLAKMIREITPVKAFLLAILLLYAGAEIFMYQSGDRQRIIVDVIFIICSVIGWHTRANHQRFVAMTYSVLAGSAIIHTLSRF